MKAPHFWSAGLDPKSREAAPLTRALLTPLAALYDAGLRRKLARANPAQVDAKVICVGNLTTGGVGKTPVVEAIRARLAAEGSRAASLSRGYGGRLKGPLRVDPAIHTADETGDEPLMLAATGESWIGRDRAHAARAMTAAGVQVIVMDDGHQNPSLAKHLSFVVIDAEAPFGNGYLLPKGPLREPVVSGLARSDAVILMGDGPVPAAVTVSRKPVLRARLVPCGAPPSGPLVAFAGIGRPVKFFDALIASGADVRDAIPFGDHHAYAAHDLAHLTALSADHGAKLVTTSKDHVRLPPAMKAQVHVFAVTLQFESPEALDALLAPLFKQD